LNSLSCLKPNDDLLSGRVFIGDDFILACHRQIFQSSKISKPAKNNGRKMARASRLTKPNISETPMAQFRSVKIWQFILILEMQAVLS
jgi:hypothetical protein